MFIGEIMTTEKPLNIEQFFMTRNEIASKRGGKLELTAMSNVRKHMVEEQAKHVLANSRETKETKKK